MSEFKDYLKTYAQKELELSGFDQTDFGKTVTILLENLADLSKDDPNTMKQLVNLLPRLIDRQPIAPITEDDFELESVTDGDKSVGIARCTRYPYAYRTPDGKYWDDRAVAFRYSDEPDTNKIYLYQLGNSSKQEIILPYYPSETIKVIDRD